MDSDYDRKFEEMKKYIPFLESMIKRLESTSSTSANPRQAQLAKIRSLRDLLLDKKKRMKMENLLKCEQVLVNLYAKVEQRDSFPDTKNEIDTSQETQNDKLDFVRNKLKNVSSQLQDQETLPEIARASQTEEICTAGSKEPALFQRRPNKTSKSPIRSSLNNSRESLSPSSRRNYTRVLVSPERDSSNWTPVMSSESPLFSRRSPRWTPRKSPKKSPRRYPLIHHTKERNKSSKQSQESDQLSQESNQLKDLNITLKVPEESLHSLNTKDILSRIINCSDNDVNIDTLRELRTQILSELKQTGAKDDISDLILKSYKNKREVQNKKEEIEEGELSDSESEIIESIYGSLVIMDKDQGSISCVKKSDDKDQQPRKIQICLVINSEKETENEGNRTMEASGPNSIIDESDFESYKESKEIQKVVEQVVEVNKDQENQEFLLSEPEKSLIHQESINKTSINANTALHQASDESEETKDINNELRYTEDLKPNCYKPKIIHDKVDTESFSAPNTSTPPLSTNASGEKNTENTIREQTQKQKSPVEIPLLDLEATAKQEVVNEIDILQALKKEILSEKMPLADSDTVTPPLHQPKVTKVANIHGIVSKKRISIEKYKQKSVSGPKPSFFTNESSASKDDLLRKQSLKLTEKEYERFNLSKLALDESSDDEETGKISPSIDDIYGDLAPKSPDHEDFADTGIKPPIIIPADPVKTATVLSKADVDMRTLLPGMSPHMSSLKSGSNLPQSTINFEKTFDVSQNEIDLCINNDKRTSLSDPRVRRDFHLSGTDSPILGTVDRPSRPHINFPPNMTPSRMPNIITNVTPNRLSGITQSSNIIPNMTPNVSSNTSVYEMTPSRQSFESDDYSKQNHVYAPLFQDFEVHDPNNSVSNDGQNQRSNTVHSNTEFQNSPMFNRLECSQTPIHPFGMSECPPTPTHTFGRMEMPMTPIHTFGRSEAPMTPVHPFGRADCPSTPSHPFGRTEVLMTPSHPFGRTDFSQNQLPSHIPPLMFNKFQDPRINRSSDYDTLSKYEDDNIRSNYNDRNSSNFNTRNYKFDQSKRHYSDSYRNYGREQSVGRNDISIGHEQVDSRYGERSSRRESSIGRSSRNYDTDRHYSNSRGKGYRDRDYRYESDCAKNFKDSNSRRNYKRENNFGRVQEDRYVGRNNDREAHSENTLSVQSHAGRAFTIDTSVNRSFQEQLKNLKSTSVSASNFDARRRRASSVGRSLVRDPSTERDLAGMTNSQRSPVLKDNNKFRRACSVGRDIGEYDSKKNFKDIKEDLQSYKHKNDTRNYQKNNTTSSNKNIATGDNKKINDRDPRLSRRDHHDLQYSKNAGQSSKFYSLKKNIRDPRFNREINKEPQKIHQEQFGGKSAEIKKHGIVYSSDNIANGVILGSGYGVKNYKIPKIKRATEEVDNKETVEKLKTTSGKKDSESVTNKIDDNNTKFNNLKQKDDKVDDEKDTNNLDKYIENVDKCKAKERKCSRWETPENVNNLKNKNQNISTSSNVDDIVERRVTRSARKSIVSEPSAKKSDSPAGKANKSRKKVFYDSDSDNTEILSTDKDSQYLSLKDKEKKDMEPMCGDGNKNIDTLNNEKITIDLKSEQRDIRNEEKINDATIFDKHTDSKDIKPTESLVSNQTEIKNTVLDSTNCFGMDIEMFSDNVVTDPVIDNINALIADLDDDLETSKNDDFKNQFTKEITLENMLENITCEEKKAAESSDKNMPDESTDEYTAQQFSKKSSRENISINDCSELEVKQDEDVINERNSEVSTTENEKSVVQPEKKEPQKQNYNQKESCSTPDSTIDVNETCENKICIEGMPDSTNELACEMSSDITSTHDPNEILSKHNVEVNPLPIELAHQSDSIGSLLSILKDKSKIKELLTMLKDQSSENDKLKKKLEKLSEIVSDDEDFPPSESNLPQCNNNNQTNLSLSDKSNQVDTDNCKLEVNKQLPLVIDDVSHENVDDAKVVNSYEVSKDKDEVLNRQGLLEEQSLEDAKDIEHEENLEGSVQSSENSNIFDDKNEISCSQNIVIDEQCNSRKKSVKNIKTSKKGKGKVMKPSTLDEKKRLTRSDSANIKVDTPKNVKKPSRELKQLQEDIKEMFLHDDVFNATGIRMCRLAKLVEDKPPVEKSESNNTESNPVVILQKIKEASEDSVSKGKTSKKKVASKSKGSAKEIFADTEQKTPNSHENMIAENKIPIKCRPGPKSKTRVQEKQADADPYIFETDSIIETNNFNVSEDKLQSSSESECDSLSSFKSFGSTEQLVEVKKKPKRKRRGWQAGVIKPKHKKKKVETNTSESETVGENVAHIHFSIPDVNCFIDKTYCFNKNVSVYSCRLCLYSGSDIVHHFKKQHPHAEIPLSRMSPEVAKEAIEQCEVINILAISTIPTDKYICRFCFKEFGKKKTVLESFFWHVVSMHTGEYKQLCSECINVTKCPFNLDIPPPPKEPKGQLIGYICGKCNFTQVSLENLKTHVINRHNDEQTEVYTINLAVMSKKTLALAATKSTTEQPRVLRSSRSNQNVMETNLDEDSDFNANSDNESKSDKAEKYLKQEMTHVDVHTTHKPNKTQLKITFENDEATNEISNLNKATNVKIEHEQEIYEKNSSQFIESLLIPDTIGDQIEANDATGPNQASLSDDILDYPHFKITYTKAGTKEYVCCINGIENHYRTALIISLKKHVQIKHLEKWDGFCFVCKLIVTPQGNYHFKDCLQHFLDKHMDSFPLWESPENKMNMETNVKEIKANKSYLNVRPLSELITPTETRPTLPVIERVVSLGAFTDEAPRESIDLNETKSMEKEYKYEEAQAEIIAKKNNVVLEIMMKREKLVHIFKCAGRFCSYSTDHAEDALRHAVTHERVGGENSLHCAYCDFDSSNNAVDLVTHVFKAHGSCQFVCAECFYRGAASQLVRAHAHRVHGKVAGQSIILRSTVTARSDIVHEILSREIAVPFYICCQNVNEAGCKFKTYTSGKFWEHLQSRHQLDTSFSCFICSAVFTKSVDLVQHMKSHGFKLYQCTWCVHGADNEAELLAHASEKHPNKLPQAYLRVITNKEGTTGFRVLPLAHLNNSKIATEDVTPSNIRGNPEREAERSIDLEKLIGETTQMIESMETSTENESSNFHGEEETITIPSFKPEPLIQSQESLVMALQSSLLEQTQEASLSNDVSLEPVLDVPPRPETPKGGIQSSVESDVHGQLTPVLKLEPAQRTPEKINSDIIYCLDSDDETPNVNVIDLSTEEPPPGADDTNKSEKLKLIPQSSLFKCGLCSMIFKSSSGFKRHVSASHSQVTTQLPCAYCPFVASRDLVVKHYVTDHSLTREDSTRYQCGVCNNRYVSFQFVKKHLKDDHNVSKLVVTSKLVANGSYQFIVGKANKQKLVTKIKSLRESEDKTSQPKPKKFGPEDVYLLPINPILDELVYCSLCEFSTKVRLNMVRHLQLHAEQQPVPQTAPVNPVPHLESNEKHFDKMVNLASSSIASRAPEKSNKADQQPVVNLLIPPEAASRYPKYVPDRQRYTCGAKGCCYISVDEAMLKYHWETLHSNANDFHCVHCPPYQHLDTTKPLTASRIIAHLKMHDIRLYACSCCSYYHHRRLVLDKHIAEVHNTGHVMVVREESVSPVPTLSQPSTATPTMDLKPWQCGLCKFKSMLRPEVSDHCAKVHQSKMQYKCAYCAFRTSTLENIMKHQLKSHAGKDPETFYFYYREGSIPDEPDGTPRWQKQRQKSGITETQVKTETIESTEMESQSELTKQVPNTLPVVDLNLVKQDPDAVTTLQETVEDLCKAFGQFCDPNGVKYKCPLCDNVSEDCKDAMQSHLYEELQYRKWGCGFCSYKAFHKNGLNDHMLTEHRQNRDPIELPVDLRVETWITKLLDRQFLLIEKHRQSLIKKITAVSSNPTPSKSQSQVTPMEVTDGVDEHNMEDLEKLFGKFGVPDNMNFCCPKCNLKFRDENLMRDHLEIELNKIRWCCDCCSYKFQNYHEAQFHCKSVHAGLSARAVEAVRDVRMRSAWIAAVLRVQKLSMNYLPVTETTDTAKLPENSMAPDNSLLVVRYEERVPTPELQAVRPRTSAAESDEDDEKLVIDEPSNQTDGKQCPFCMQVCKDRKNLKGHVLQHINIKPYFCSYCDFNGYRRTVLKHLNDKHQDKPSLLMTKSQRSLGPPLGSNPVIVTVEDDASKLICLMCEKPFSDTEAKAHSHDKTKPTFAKKGQVVVKCCLCLSLHENIDTATAHHTMTHPNETLNYAYYKLQHDRRRIFCCGYCDQHFKFWRDLKAHWKAIHSSLPLLFNKRNFAGSLSDAVISLDDDDETGVKRKSESPPAGPAPKMCARKSTTKLPCQAVAKKSTTKLPFYAESELNEYSFYGTKPQVEDLGSVTTRMPFCNTMVPFTFKQLSEVIQINPKVLVRDINK